MDSVIFSKIGSFHHLFREESQIKFFCVFFFSNNYLMNVFLYHTVFYWLSHLHQSYSLNSQLVSSSADFPGDGLEVLVNDLIDHHLDPLPQSLGPLLGGGVTLQSMLVTGLDRHYLHYDIITLMTLFMATFIISYNWHNIITGCFSIIQLYY